ncbi:putative Mg2+ transporter-like zinc transport protein [Naviculisporaceae sp. PSN 640]
MDKLLFLSELSSRRVSELEPSSEATKWLEILNFAEDDGGAGDHTGRSPRPASETTPNALNEGGLQKFLSRQAPFPSTSLENVTSGLRLLIQQDVKEPKAFFPGALPFKREQYELVVDTMNLPLEAIDGTSVVGPFFWWTYVEDPVNPKEGFLQMVFRKSDVQWQGTSRGWEIALSYSTATRVTSGYIRGMATSGVQTAVDLLGKCAQPACHPLLLPFLMMRLELSPDIEVDQRKTREDLRSLETRVSNRYNHIKAPAPGYAPKDIDLDSINWMLAEYQCQTMQKNPRSWISAIKRMEEAMEAYWRLVVPAHQGDDAARLNMPKDLHAQKDIMTRRLRFMVVRLEGLESYAQVTLERLNIQREVMNSIISQRESRLNLAIAAQQRRIAHTTGRDSTSMKTLTLLGVMFLPGAFLSSIFGMSFFDFSDDIRNSVSPRLYMFFVIFVLLTIFILVFWWKFDKYSTAKADTKVSDNEMNELEEQIMDAIRTRTKARVNTNPISSRLGDTDLGREDPVSRGAQTGSPSLLSRIARMLWFGKLLGTGRLLREDEDQGPRGPTGTTEAGRDVELGGTTLANGSNVPHRVSWGPNRHI